MKIEAGPKAHFLIIIFLCFRGKYNLFSVIVGRNMIKFTLYEVCRKTKCSYYSHLVSDRDVSKRVPHF